MSSRPSSAPPAEPLPASELAVLAELAEARATLEPPAIPCLIRVRVLGPEVELGWLPLRPDAHPLDELVGRTIPPDWHAIGLVAMGRAHRLDADDDAEPLRVRTTHLVGRDGSWASRCWPVDAEPMTSSGGPDAADRVVGRLDDACRRALGVPTAPPDVGSGPLWAARWLDAVVEAAGSRPRAMRWPAVARLHPAVSALLPDAPDADVDPEHLGHLAHQLATWRDWPVLRRTCAAGTWSTPEIGPELAAWLDDGAFCRWALGAYPPLADLWAIVADLLPRSLAVSVAQTLVVSGVAP